MPNADGFKKFFEKRGFSVHKIVVGYDGFMIWIDQPVRAREVFDSIADTTNLVFVSHKSWYQRLMFWRK